MGLKLWKKIRLVRRFGDPVPSGGYMVPTSTEFRILADVQTTSKQTGTRMDGHLSAHWLKVFTETELKAADELTGVPGDWLWFRDKWYECRATRKSENTFLTHWTAEFVEVANQDAAPQADFYICGTCLIAVGTPGTVWVDGTTLCVMGGDSCSASEEGLMVDGRELTFDEFEALAAGGTA